MKTVTFTKLRENAKLYFDAVEEGETVRVLRHGKPIADILPAASSARTPSWRKSRKPLCVKGVSLTKAILEERNSGR